MKILELYNGARLWQYSEVFPKSFPKSGIAGRNGHIRTAIHSNNERVVYLTDSFEIASVYGTITKWTDVRDGLMRFHPTGMVLGVDATNIVTKPLPQEQHTAKNLTNGMSERVLITMGSIPTSKIVSASFLVYEQIVCDPAVTLVTDGFPEFDSLEQNQIRDSSRVTDRVRRIAEKVREEYPDIDVNLYVSQLTSTEAIEIFEAT